MLAVQTLNNYRTNSFDINFKAKKQPTKVWPMDFSFETTAESKEIK